MPRPGTSRDRGATPIHDDDDDETGGWGHGRRRSRRRRGPRVAQAWIGDPPEPPFPPFPPAPPGVGFMFGGGGRRRGRGRARRGDIRAAIVLVLAERPMHGYEVMNELAERSGGMWRPSPGSVYPTLQQLEDEDLVRPEELDGKRVFRLTEAGQAEAEQLGTRGAPWDVLREGVGKERRALHRSLAGLAAAVGQLRHAGNDAQIAQAQTLLDDTRRQIYRLLAEDEGGGEGGAEPGPAADPPSA